MSAYVLRSSESVLNADSPDFWARSTLSSSRASSAVFLRTHPCAFLSLQEDRLVGFLAISCQRIVAFRLRLARHLFLCQPHAENHLARFLVQSWPSICKRRQCAGTLPAVNSISVPFLCLSCESTSFVFFLFPSEGWSLCLVLFATDDRLEKGFLF